MSSFTYQCGRCGGSIGPPPDGQKDHVCADLRPDVPTVEAEDAVTFVDPIIEHARHAGKDGVDGE